MIARVLALIGIIMITAGLLLPAVCPASGCDIPDNGLINPDNFENDVETGVLFSIYGLLTAAAALPALIGLISGERGAMLYSALASGAVVALNFGVQYRLLEAPATLGYGWAVMAGGSVLLLLAAVLMKPALVTVGGTVSSGGAVYTPNKTLIEPSPSLNKTRIEGVPGGGAPGPMNKTAIDINFQNPKQQAQAPADKAQQPPYGQQQNLPPIPGFGENLNPEQKTLVDSPAPQQQGHAQQQWQQAWQQQPAIPSPQADEPETAKSEAPGQEATPPSGSSGTYKTQVDGIIAPPPEEPDPYAWQRAGKTMVDAPETRAPAPEASTPAPAPAPEESLKTNIAPIREEAAENDEERHATNIVPQVDENSPPPASMEGRTSMLPNSEELRAMRRDTEEKAKPKADPDDPAYKTMPSLQQEKPKTPDSDDPAYKTMLSVPMVSPSQPDSPEDDLKTFIDTVQPQDEDEDDDRVRE